MLVLSVVPKENRLTTNWETSLQYWGYQHYLIVSPFPRKSYLRILSMIDVDLIILSEAETTLATGPPGECLEMFNSLGQKLIQVGSWVMGKRTQVLKWLKRGEGAMAAPREMVAELLFRSDYSFRGRRLRGYSGESPVFAIIPKPHIDAFLRYNHWGGRLLGKLYYPPTVEQYDFRYIAIGIVLLILFFRFPFLIILFGLFLWILL